jgi:hypothetical protein
MHGVLAAVVALRRMLVLNLGAGVFTRNAPVVTKKNVSDTLCPAVTEDTKKEQNECPNKNFLAFAGHTSRHSRGPDGHNQAPKPGQDSSLDVQIVRTCASSCCFRHAGNY